MSDQNIKGLQEATLVLVVARNAGNDTSWEVGFAKALGKKIVLLYAEEDIPQRHPMLWHSADIYLPTKAYTDAEHTVRIAFETKIIPTESRT